MRVVSFDIGLKTCSVAVEDYKDELKKLQQQYPTVPYSSGGESTEELKKYIKTVGLLGQVVHLEKKELGEVKGLHNGTVFRTLYEWCESLRPHVHQADLVLIEQQMRVNNIAISIMYHLQAWLMIQFPKLDVRLYPSKNKTRVLGAPLTMTNKKGQVVKVTKYQRKKWSTEYAKELLTDRKDKLWHDFIFVTNKKKKDDLSDVLTQALSYIVATSAPIGSGKRKPKGTSAPKKSRKRKEISVEVEV